MEKPSKVYENGQNMKNNKKLRVAIIGCGNIASDHIETIKAKCEPVELHLCDKNLEAAQTLGKKVGLILPVYEDAFQLISGKEFNIVHILTPPNSHYEIAKHAIQNGANVLVEKPMVLSLEETEKLYQVSEKMNRMLCVDHSLLYMDCVLKALEMLKTGTLGRVIEAHCFFGHAERRKSIPYGGVSHWAYNLPGGPLTNLITHPASLVIQLLGNPDSINVMCDARNLMPYGLSDMLDISIQTSKGHGSFSISMAHGNSSRYVNIECEKGSIYVDLGHQLAIVKFHKGRLGFLSKALSGFVRGISFINGTTSVILKVATGKMKKNPGTRELVARFYHAVRNNLSSPVSKDNALAVAKILDKFIEVNNSKSRHTPCHTQLNPVEAEQES